MNGNLILIFLGISYVAQILLSNRQLSIFRKNMSEMAAKGKIGVGRQKGLLKGSALIIAFEPNGKVIEARGIKGSTVFAKMNELPEWQQKSPTELTNLAKGTPWEKPLQEALTSVSNILTITESQEEKLIYD